MQLTLNVDSAQLGTEVSEFLKTLTEADKKTMVEQILKDYYSEYTKYDASEKKLKDKEALDYVKRESYQAREGKQTEDEMRKSSYYSDYLKRVPTMAEKIQKEISALVQTELTNTVRDFVNKDPQYKILVEESMAEIKAQFPKMVQNAMVAHMALQLPQLVQQLQLFGGDISKQLGDFNQRLNSRGY